MSLRTRLAAAVIGAVAIIAPLAAAPAHASGTAVTTGVHANVSTSAAASAPKAVSAADFDKTVKPKMSVSPRVGRQVTAVRGTFSPAPSFTYTWKVSGKVVGHAKTFTPQASHRGKKLTLTVTAKRTGYKTLTQSTPAAVVGVGLFSKAPTPKITGSTLIGSTVKAKTGTWSPKANLKYQWLRSGKAIKGATKSSYKLTSTDWKKSITVRVTGTKSGYKATAKHSSALKAVKKFTRAAVPTISASKIRVGSKLTARAGSWSPKAKFTYQWKRNGSAIKGATKSTYVLKSADRGKKITVTVTGKATGYRTTAKTSRATAKVAAAPKPKPSTATPSGYNCPSSAPIKGNADSGIYHVPGGRYYDRTKPEQCFSTESAARAAGYRASKV